MNLKKVSFFVILILLAAGLLFSQRSTDARVSATVSTKPGAGNSKFYFANVRNNNSYNVRVEVVFTTTLRSGETTRAQYAHLSVPARQTKSIQITSGTILRVNIVELNVTRLN